ncbi:MAG TPA: hypothetical protein DIW77_16385 [Chromatiaceae bacterium]|nr:MAG: hypothetical protein N838_33185 [Thiohalocapsa sp. PB-PSB1]HCS91571.1 hypothetical protein [Chromatiaceae bacterium]
MVPLLAVSAVAKAEWWILNANTFECSTIGRSPNEIAGHPDCTMTGNNKQLGAYEVTCKATATRPKA